MVFRYYFSNHPHFLIFFHSYAFSVLALHSKSVNDECVQGYRILFLGADSKFSFSDSGLWSLQLHCIASKCCQRIKLLEMCKYQKWNACGGPCILIFINVIFMGNKCLLHMGQVLPGPGYLQLFVCEPGNRFVILCWELH